MRTCNLRKGLGVEQVRSKGNMMWMFVFMYVLYDWQWMEQESAFTHLPKSLYGEELWLVEMKKKKIKLG